VRFAVTLPAEPRSASRARQFARQAVVEGGRPEHADAVALACTELVANAVLHAHTPVELTIVVGDEVRVEVRDSSVALPSDRGYGREATTGRGLALVAAVADRHGVTDVGPDGKTVWFVVSDSATPDELSGEWSAGDWGQTDAVAAPPPAESRAPELLGLPAGQDVAPAVPGGPGPSRTTDRDGATRPAVATSEGVGRLGAGEGTHGAQAPASPDPARDQASGPGAPGRTVHLLGLPIGVWLDAREHHDALLRETTLFLARHADHRIDIAATDRARSLLSAAVMAVVRDAQRRGPAAAPATVGPTVPLSPLPGVPALLDVQVDVPLAARVDLRAMHRTLEVAERLAEQGRLLIEPGSPEVVGLRRWMCHQVVGQLDGGRAEPWSPEPEGDVPPRRPRRERPVSPSPIDYVTLFRSLPTPYMVMDRELVVVEANDAYLATVGRTRGEIIGRPVFDSFPPSPDALDADGVPRVQRSFELARDTGRPHTMPLQKYDIPGPHGLEERFWSLISIPILAPDGSTALIAQRAEDITDFVRARDREAADRQTDEEWRRRVEEVEADLFARAQELAVVLEEKDATARRLAGLSEAALALTGADSVKSLEEIVVGRAVAAIGASGGAVLTADPGGGWRVSVSSLLPDQVGLTYGWLPTDSPLPAAWCARTRRRVLLPTVEASLRFDPSMAEVFEQTGQRAWACLPLQVGDEVLGSLSVSWTEEHRVTPDELELLDALAAQVAQGLDRLRARDAERAAAREAQRMSEALQRSLLTSPVRSEALRIAVRYQPAAQEAQVGGDWYDAFATAAGSTVLAVGDVNGHDRAAAALMGQLRNLLRGMAYDSDDSPATLTARLDGAMRGLGLDTLATAVLARVEELPPEVRDLRPPGTRLLRWSNAGHLPPVLRRADGTVRVLEHVSDLLLGVDPSAARTERFTELEPGSVLVLYTDGLVERRTTGLAEGIRRLAGVVEDHPDTDPEGLADRLLRAFEQGSQEDDVALLVVRVEPAA
jgi:serine phosphatase RsbU (regulator of sigma subunit)/PAS domain-containing protein